MNGGSWRPNFGNLNDTALDSSFRKGTREKRKCFFFWKTSDSDTNFQFDQFLRWVLGCGLSCRHTVSTPITVGTHTSGAQYQGSPEAPGPMALPQWTSVLESYAFGKKRVRRKECKRYTLRSFSFLSRSSNSSLPQKCFL